MSYWLLTHPESDCIFECTKRWAYQQHLAQGCEDVTGIPKYERLFQQAQEKGKKMATKTQNRGRVRVTAPEVKKDEESGMPYHVKYRPQHLDEVLGQDAAIRSLEQALRKSTHPHAFLFTGPSGTGKTTLARIVAKEFGCAPANIIETDAATNTGIDAMREITSTLRYQGFGEQPNKMIILDECHALTKAAWQSLLKAVEEPPEHVYFAFCTTESGKVPETIRTRCHCYDLKPVRYDDLMDLLERVLIEENLGTPPKILEMIARACDGSPRKALVMLSMLAECQDEEEAAVLLAAPLENKEIIDLCRLLVSNQLEWSKVQSLLKSIDEQNAESIRIVAVNYLNACLLNAREKDVPRLLDILSSFMTPCNPSDKLAPILLAIGNHIYPV